MLNYLIVYLITTIYQCAACIRYILYKYNISIDGWGTECSDDVNSL